MEVSVVFTGAPDGDNGPFYLGRSAELLALDRRVKRRGALAELIASGTFHGTDALARELAKLPADPLTDLLKELVGVGHPDESATIVDPDAANDDPG